MVRRKKIIREEKPQTQRQRVHGRGRSVSRRDSDVSRH